MNLQAKSPQLATSPDARTRPAFEKILIGPVMVFGEMITGGHYLEVLRLGKQMTVGHHAAPSYWQLHTRNVTEAAGFRSAFYRGFFPWGLIQCVKGVPVLFVQHESNYQLQRMGMAPQTSETVSGFMGGTAQAIFVCPFQKVKVSVVACEQLNTLSPWLAIRNVVTRNGVTSLYDGILPMCMRRSLDWGIRFAVSSEVKNMFVESKRRQGLSTDLTPWELIGCGLVGGACSASTHPIDNVITNSQKPLKPGARRDILAVVKRMYKESGVRAFTRGWDIKIIDNAYHMAWMYGIGTIVYESMRSAMYDKEH
mmetsp:Transcript_1857/g.4580  ORF Transcript_1857/g.4580 Transcript_1857/m.4580 type:complete len:310 (-) Transcript_1857:137-1066(-)